MQQVSARWLASLAGSPRWLTAVEWRPSAASPWRPLSLREGSVTATATSQVRWTCDLSVAGPDVAAGHLTPYGSQLRVREGLAYTREDVEWVGLGVYRLEAATVDVDRPGALKVKGASLEAQVIDDRFYTPRRIEPGSALETAAALIRETVPDARVVYRVEDAALGGFIADRERWAVVDGDRDAPSVARALGARVYTDGSGAFVIAKEPSLDDAPAWRVAAGPGGVRLGAVEESSRDGVYNAIVVNGESTEGEPPVGPGVAEDLDPLSPTFVGGPFGRVPRFYASPLLKTREQCVTAARSMLASYLGLRRSLSLETLYNPALEVGDVVEVPSALGTTRAVIDSLTYPLGGGAMQGATRTRTGRSLAATSDAPLEEDSA